MALFPKFVVLLSLYPGHLFACSTACHNLTETKYCVSAIGEKAYSMCRAGQLKLPGFPDFESAVSDFKKTNEDLPSPDYQVCCPVPNGIAIKQNLVEYWMGSEMFQLQMEELCKDHNEKYNKHGVKRGCSSEGDASGSSFAQLALAELHLSMAMSLLFHY